MKEVSIKNPGANNEIVKTILVTPWVIGFGYMKTIIHTTDKNGKVFMTNELRMWIIPFMVFTISKIIDNPDD